MSTITTPGNGDPSSDEERDSDRRCDPELVLELLSDDAAVQLYRVATAPKSVSELAQECDFSLSTVYRKVEKLEDAGLFRRTTPESSNGTPPARFERSAAGVVVTLTDDVFVEYVLAGDD